MATFTTGPNGQMLASSGPALFLPSAQNIQGSAIDAAASKSMSAQAQQVAASKALGVGQKGSSRRRRHRGGVNLNAHIPNIPTANSIPGVSMENNHLSSVNNLNQIRHDQVYDSLINATPIKMGGLRLRDDEFAYGGKRRKHTRKAKNGRRNNRTHRRGNRKSITRSRRSRRSV